MEKYHYKPIGCIIMFSTNIVQAPWTSRHWIQKSVVLRAGSEARVISSRDTAPGFGFLVSSIMKHLLLWIHIHIEKHNQTSKLRKSYF